MAELATGAVSTLLGVIGNEAVRLGRVRVDVQFIKEEMESISSFLANLAGAGREHDEQVRTWMNQARILANDCNSCIDLYLYRGDPGLNLPSEGICRYLGWAPWLLRKLIAQHRAASQLSELKDRARDIGDRRLRYGVEVKTPDRSSSSTQPLLLPTTEDHQEEEDHHDQGKGATLPMTYMSMGDEAYLKQRLDKWITNPSKKSVKKSIVILVPNTADAGPLVGQAAQVAKAHLKQVEELRAGKLNEDGVMQNKTQIEWNIVLVDVPNMLGDYEELVPWDILYYILYQLKHQQQQEGTTPTTNPNRKRLFREKIWAVSSIWNQIGMEIGPQFDEITKTICSQVEPMEDEDFNEETIPKKSLDQLLRRLIVKSTMANTSKKDQEKFTASYDIIIEETAKQLEAKIHSGSDQQVHGGSDQQIQGRSDQRIEGSSDQQMRVGSDQQIHGGSDQQIQGPSDQETEGSSDQHIHGSSDQQIHGGSNQQIQGPSDQRIEGSSDQQNHGGSDQQIHGGSDQLAPKYKGILKEVFPKPTTAATTNANTNNSTDTPVEDQIKEIIHGVREMLRDLHKLDSHSDRVTTSEPGTHAPEYDLGKSTTEKMQEIQNKIEELLVTRVMVENIQKELGGNNKRILVVLKTHDNKHVSVWEETMKTLKRLGCTSIARAIIVATKTTQNQYKEDFCYPRMALIEYPVVGRYLKTIRQSTKQHLSKEDSRWILLRDILYECVPEELPMKIFTHAMHAKPKRTSEELHKLLDTLRATQNSSPDIAAKMFNFSYKDLPKQYRSCLLYLAIFPAETEVRLSTLVGRWVAEGLITTTDWSWSSSVDEALKCSQALLASGLLSPAAIGATGRVKSCHVNEPVHGFISKIARKQRILETRLSSRLARHFSIFSDVRLRSSQQVDDFLKNIPQSSQVSKIKVLDLEECNCFKGNRKYLRDICSKILMLKYLSLRNTDVDHLPKAINNLHELEVLDIRETQIPMYATRKIWLRKLKRVLGGSRHTEFSSVHIPEKIDKMEGIEVLTIVEPRNHRDLDHIAGRFMLKKLGVVIRKESHLRALLGATKDLKRSLHSLTITLNMLTPPTDQCFKDKDPESKSIVSTPKWDPKDSVLESLSIMGSTQKKELLTWFSNNAINVAKVTISGSFRQDDMNILAKFQSLICVRLRRIHDWTGDELIFVAVQDGFKSPNIFIVEETNITKIRFEDRAASKVMKMMGLKELDQDGVAVPEKVEQDTNKNGDQSTERTILVEG